MNYNLNPFINELEQLNIHPSDEQLVKFIMYYEMLIEKNKVMNLTAITEFNDVVEKHFLDSVSLIQVKNLDDPIRVIDLGTGAGFPGIPLKIMFPNLKVTLMDSLNKRILFLQDVISKLKLDDITAVHGRAEEAGKNPLYREQYDLCVSRAVANISTLSEYCLPFVKVGGQFISYKSSVIDEELSAGKKSIHLLGGKLDRVYKFSLPDSNIERSFVMIDKVSNTPKRYPRKAGTPGKEPL